MPCMNDEYSCGSTSADGIRNYELEACLCALFCEIDKLGEEDAHLLIRSASRNSGYDVLKVWTEHKEKDKERLIAQFQKHFSVDEQELITKILINRG